MPKIKTASEILAKAKLLPGVKPFGKIKVKRPPYENRHNWQYLHPTRKKIYREIRDLNWDLQDPGPMVIHPDLWIGLEQVTLEQFKAQQAAKAERVKQLWDDLSKVPWSAEE